jgi:hypothetical protein
LIRFHYLRPRPKRKGQSKPVRQKSKRW